LVGGASGAGEVEALNRILNNINVQTKKNEIEGKLPRKYHSNDSFFSHQEMRAFITKLSFLFNVYNHSA
jgi:hypothetical protein